MTSSLILQDPYLSVYLQKAKPDFSEVFKILPSFSSEWVALGPFHRTIIKLCPEYYIIYTPTHFSVEMLYNGNSLPSFYLTCRMAGFCFILLIEAKELSCYNQQYLMIRCIQFQMWHFRTPSPQSTALTDLSYKRSDSSIRN